MLGGVLLMGAIEGGAHRLGNAAQDGQIWLQSRSEEPASGHAGAGTEAFQRVSLPMVWPCATHFDFPMKNLRVPCVYFEHQRRVLFEGCVSEPLQTITDTHPPWVDVELSAPSRSASRCSE